MKIIHQKPFCGDFIAHDASYIGTVHPIRNIKKVLKIRLIIFHLCDENDDFVIYFKVDQDFIFFVLLAILCWVEKMIPSNIQINKMISSGRQRLIYFFKKNNCIISFFTVLKNKSLYKITLEISTIVFEVFFFLVEICEYLSRP